MVARTIYSRVYLTLMTTTIYEIELLHLRQIKSHKYLKSEINCQRCIAIADRKPGAVHTALTVFRDRKVHMRVGSKMCRFGV